VGTSRLAGSISVLFRGNNYMGGLGWMRSSWGLRLGEGRGDGPGFGAGQEWLEPSCSGHSGSAKHSQTAFKTVLGFFSVFSSRTQ
jgi:hypothetical protein